MTAELRDSPAAPTPPEAEPPVGRVARLDAWWSRTVGRLRPGWLTDDVLRGLRWGSIGGWLVLFVGISWVDGLPFDRTGLLLWVSTGAAAASIGRRSIAAVVLDFLPFALVLIVYDYLRGLSDTLGMPTWWTPQIDVDRFLFGGHEPTIWLQEHLKYSHVRWYDLVVCVSYYSFFFLPYLTAGVMWLRSRRDFYRWSLRFVGLSLLGFGLFALIPAAPPWAAAHCTAADVSGHPHNPPCLSYGGPVPGNVLGAYHGGQPGTAPDVERIAGRAFYELHLGVAHQLWTEGFSVADAVAAVPSLHLGGTVLFVLFVWRRLSRWWRPVLVAYPLVMTFSLVYAGEHYVADCLAGALLATAVHLGANRIERRRDGRTERRPRSENRNPALDTLDSCPTPTRSSPGTMPSST